MATTIQDAMETAVTKAKSPKVKKPKAEPEVTPVSTAATYREALANVLMTVPKAAHKLVESATDLVVRSVQARAKNEFEIGAECRKVQGAISKESFSRWLYEVIQRVGISRTAVYRYMDQSDILTSAIPYAPAREALIGVTSGRGFFSREDGAAQLQGHVSAALRKFTAPTAGKYEDCLDWTHNVQVAIEQGIAPTKRNVGELSKQARNIFARILNGGKGVTANHKFAVALLADCYRLLATKSLDLATEFEDEMDKINDEFSKITTAPSAQQRKVA